MSVMLYAKTKQNRVEAHVLNGEQTEGAVLYTAQTLTAEEQAQARENINAPGVSDIPQKTSELENDSGFITAEDISAVPVQSVNGQTGAVKITNLVQDLGYIDGEAYDWDAGTFLDTLIVPGDYKFGFDEFVYQVHVETIVVGDQTYVFQHAWNTEEPWTSYYRSLIIEGGEIINTIITDYLDSQSASNMFASKTHNHFNVQSGRLSVWDYCATSPFNRAFPSIIYFSEADNSTWLIEAITGIKSPVPRLQRVTNLSDPSKIYQRMSSYYSGTDHWSSWYVFSGEVYTPGR